MKKYFEILGIKLACIIWLPILFVVHIIRHLFYGVSKFRLRSGNGLDYYSRDRKEFVILAMRSKYGWIIWFIWAIILSNAEEGTTAYAVCGAIYVLCVILSFLPLEYIFYPPGKFTSEEIYEYERAKKNKNK